MPIEKIATSIKWWLDIAILFYLSIKKTQFSCSIWHILCLILLFAYLNLKISNKLKKILLIVELRVIFKFIMNNLLCSVWFSLYISNIYPFNTHSVVADPIMNKYFRLLLRCEYAYSIYLSKSRLRLSSSLAIQTGYFRHLSPNTRKRSIARKSPACSFMVSCSPPWYINLKSRRIWTSVGSYAYIWTINGPSLGWGSS